MNHMTPAKKYEKEEILAPIVEATKINGKLFYSEGDQSWSLLRLKKDLFKDFPQLKERKSSFGYKMIISKTPEELKKMVSEVEKTGAIPILLYFNRETKID